MLPPQRSRTSWFHVLEQGTSVPGTWATEESGSIDFRQRTVLPRDVLHFLVHTTVVYCLMGSGKPCILHYATLQRSKVRTCHASASTARLLVRAVSSRLLTRRTFGKEHVGEEKER